jgi:Fe-S cluster biogenesis protein NfuA
MKMGIERALKQAFPQIKEVIAINPSAYGSSATEDSDGLSVEEVKGLLENLIPAINGLGGAVEVVGVDNTEGKVSIRFSGPDRLKIGIEGVLLDHPPIKTVEFLFM